MDCTHHFRGGGNGVLRGCSDIIPSSTTCEFFDGFGFRVTKEVQPWLTAAQDCPAVAVHVTKCELHSLSPLETKKAPGVIQGLVVLAFQTMHCFVTCGRTFHPDRVERRGQTMHCPGTSLRFFHLDSKPLFASKCSEPSLRANRPLPIRSHGTH